MNTVDRNALLDAIDRDGRAMTIREFCIVENMSTASYYKMRRSGYGPDEFRIPNSAIVRITPQARQEWHKSIEALRKTEAIKLEEQRRSDLARSAGRASAASPYHVARQRHREAAQLSTRPRKTSR